MQIKLIIDNLEENILHECKVLSLDASLICFKPSQSISSWIIDYYLTRISSEQIQPTNMIGSYEMFDIFQWLERSSMGFLQLCQNKLNQIEKDQRLEEYNHYLQRRGLIDLIDLFHQCQSEWVMNTLVLSSTNVKNDIDRLFFEYLVRLPSSTCYLYDLKTKLSTPEVNENLVKLITSEKLADEPMNNKVHIKHALCTYLSLLSDTRNEHALIQCLVTFSHIGIDREMISELRSLSENASLTIYEILVIFLRRKEFSANDIPSVQWDLTDKRTDLLEKLHSGLKEFFDSLERIQKIVEENKSQNIQPIVTFRKVLQSISKQIFKDKLSDQCDLKIQEIIEEFCQCFEINPPITNGLFHQSLSYICAKQTTGLPLSLPNNDQIGSSSAENLGRRYKREQYLDLSTIHETSFESDTPTTTGAKIPLPSAVKRQPLREIDVNSFDNQERPSEKPVTLELMSNGDKENIPMLTRKRSISSTHNEPANKKQKKSNIKPSETGQQMMTSFFQSTD